MKKITLLVIMSFLPFLGFAQFPENFDGGVFPPAGWQVANNGVGPAQSWVANSTPGFALSAPTAAFCNSETIAVGATSEDWLISPQVTVPTNGQVRFWLRQLFVGNQGTLLKIKVYQGGTPTNLAAYTTVKTFTEVDLGELDNLVYFEHFADLLGYSGTPVYIAFVREFTRGAVSTGGDRFLLDDLRLVEKCLDPTSLDAPNVTTNTAQLTWLNTSGATQWDIELVNTTAGQTPNFAAPDYPNIAANNSYGISGLLPDTSYAYYIRAKCTNGFNSEWIGPLNFTTRPLGSSCATPIAVSTLPYSHTTNTLLYSDTIDGASGCVAGNYLNGNEVVYQYTPTFTGNIIVNMTPAGGAIDTGVFIYNGASCANIVAAGCLAGVANGTSGVREISSFAVTNGVPIYIVVSSDGSPQTFQYTLLIQRLNCLPPTNLQVGGITQTAATFTWNIVGGVTNWEYVLQAPGLGVPTGSGTPVLPATNSLTLSTLNPSSQYEFYVRADCGDGINFSPWTGPITFNTLCGAIPVPFTEGFNTNSTTQYCWTVNNVNADANTWNMNYAINPYEGNEVASMVTSSATNNDWLISPQLTLTGNQRLRYRYRTETAVNHNFEVKLSTASNAPADFTTTLVAQTNYNNTTYVEKIVNLNAIPAGPIFIGFHVAPGANGPRIYIDQVIVEDIPPCPNPLDLIVTSVGSDTVTLDWNPGNNETSWQVYITPTGLPAPVGTTAGVTTGPTSDYVAPNNLNPVTTYDAYILSNCGVNGNSGWVGPVTFTTTQVPGTVPYVDGFEATPQWSLINGTQTNKWVIGTAVNNGGTKSMYVSNDAGVSNSYSVNATSVVHAYRDITIPNGITNLNLAFDWRNEGEKVGATDNDYFSVWIVPTNYAPTPGTALTAGAGRTKFGANYDLNPLFVTQNITIPAAAYLGQTVRLVFEWRNNGSAGIQPPAAIDNINLTVLTCPAPSALTATGATVNSAILNWTAGGTEALWDIVVQPLCSGAPTASSTIIDDQTKPYTASGLADSAAYEYYVRAECSGTNSFWVGPFVFNTEQVPATLNYTDGFENVNKWTLSNGTQVNKWVVETDVNNGGAKSLYVSNTRCFGNSNTYSIASASTVHAYRDVTVPTGVDLLSLSFDWRSVGDTNDYLRVWVVPSTFTPNPGSAITTAAGRSNISGSLTGSATFRTQNYLIPATVYAGQTMRLVFEWRNDASVGTQPPAAVDNINLAIVTCPPPTALGVVSTAATSAILTWTPVGAATQWEVYAVPSGSSAPGPGSTGAIVNAIPAQITGLLPTTQYTYYVRSICSTTDVGPWTQTGFDFFTRPINDECADATLVPVNSDIYCDQSITGSLAFATPSIQATPACVGTNADDDVWFQFVATNSYLTIAFDNIVGMAANNLTWVVYSGACGTMTPIGACNSNADAQAVVNNLVVGQIYYIRVYSNNTTAVTATFDVCITTPSTCKNSRSICTVAPYVYSNTTGVTSLGTIGCLGTSPNPTFFTIQIGQSGPVNFEIAQTSLTGGTLDVDYAAWGPFTNQSLACANLPNPTTGVFSPPINLAPPAGNPQDYGCSYNPAPVEQFNIPNAIAGELYIILVTNFSNQAGTITISQANLNQPGSGQTLCCPSADFSYNPVSYCKGTSANPIPTIPSGAIAGFFSCVSANSAGLVFVSTATGEIDLAASQPGTYLIKNDTTGAAGTCAGQEDYFTVVINAPQSAVISYPDSTPLTPGAEFCQSAGPQPVTVTGDQNGFFSLIGQNQIGLSINTDTGQINPSQSQPGTYTVNYYFLGNNSCAAAPITTTVTINPSPIWNPVVTQPDCETPTGTVILAANANYEYSSDNGVTYGSSNTFANLTPNTTYLFAVRDLTNGCVTTNAIIINPLPASPPTPTATPTPATCTANGAIRVDSPLSGNRIYTNLFISEVFDQASGSLSYIEIYNGTGAAVDLRNYKLRFFTVPATPTVPTAGCNFALGLPATFMLANNDTWVVKVSTSPFIPGVVADQTVSACAGVNVDDRIELATSTDQTIDLWGRSDFVAFTPNGQPGYTYRRLNSATAPSTTWNPLDWDVIDPENTADIGLFTAQAYNYTYSIDGVVFQTGVDFLNVPYSATPYTVTVKDPVTKCTSTVQVTISNPAPFASPALSLVSPASCNATNPNATVSVTNPMGAGYDYYINNVLNTDPLNAISLPASATPYVIEVRETATGCVTSASITINAPAVVTAPIVNLVAAATCNNTQTATVEVTNPAAAGFTYYINNVAYTGALNSIALVASATPYTIEVRDDVSECSASATITITAAPQPAAPTFDAAATVQPTCTTPTGTIVVLTPAAATGYEYAVDGNAYQAGVTFTGLAAGVAHTVTVRDLVTGCVSNPTSITLDAVPSPVTLFTTQGCANGVYTLVVDPNDSDYTYEWTNPSGTVISTTNTAIATVVGVYTVTVTTDEGCISTAPVTVLNTVCEIPKGISPNNDSMNDSFDLSSLNVNKLSIFNRYGTVVYEHGAGYTDQWHGQSKGGETLPDGTYFYVIESGDGQSKTGWVYINKER